MGKFWEGVGGKLADRWATVAGPALLFWLGGLLAWAHHAGGLHRLSTPTDWLNGQTILTQIAVVLTALLAVLASGMLVDRLTFPTLRLLEGYWPGWTTRCAAGWCNISETEPPPRTPTGKNSPPKC